MGIFRRLKFLKIKHIFENFVYPVIFTSKCEPQYCGLLIYIFRNICNIQKLNPLKICHHMVRTYVK